MPALTRWIAVALCVASLAAHAQQSVPRSRAFVVPADAADGCVITPIACNTDVRGRLGVNDCTFSDGAYYDRFSFQASVGEIVAVTIRPLSPTFTEPFITLVPPQGDASETPFVAGGRASTVWYKISSSGSWTIFAGATTPSSSGDYVLHMECFRDLNPSAPQNCIHQELLCGQVGIWTLTEKSCRYAPPASTRFNTPWRIHGVAGDVLTVRQESDDFAPLFGIYDEEFALLQSSTAVSGSVTSTTYAIPRTGLYHIVTTATTNGSVGEFAVNVECARSGCLFPYFTGEIPNAAVTRGAQATVRIPVDLVGSFTAELLDENDAVVGMVTDSLTITTPRVDSERRLRVRVTTPCGQSLSNSFTVSPGNMRRRSVR